jgi:hypothetical protein
MRVPNVEKQIVKLGPEASAIYFAAKNSLVSARDSRSEQFSAAAQTVKAFWKMVLQMETGQIHPVRQRVLANRPAIS